MLRVGRFCGYPFFYYQYSTSVNITQEFYLSGYYLFIFTDDIYALPDGQRAELIDGKLYNMAPPSRNHQRIILELSIVISNYIKNRHDSCEVNVAPFAVFLNDDNKNYVEPDISMDCII